MSDDDDIGLSYRDRLALRIVRALIELSKPKGKPSPARRRRRQADEKPKMISSRKHAGL
jgi:hypothetical protein